jgi:hypothetical protein
MAPRVAGRECLERCHAIDRVSMLVSSDPAPEALARAAVSRDMTSQTGHRCIRLRREDQMLVEHNPSPRVAYSRR